MKLTTLFAIMLITSGVYAQAPQLSTADKIAIQACEKAKQDARTTFDTAQKQESEILKEWQSAHPGFTIDPQSFEIEPVKAPAKVPVPEPAKK